MERNCRSSLLLGLEEPCTAPALFRVVHSSFHLPLASSLAAYEKDEETLKTNRHSCVFRKEVKPALLRGEAHVHRSAVKLGLKANALYMSANWGLSVVVVVVAGAVAGHGDGGEAAGAGAEPGDASPKQKQKQKQ
uniref:Uncharacterized protein n=1 Tax=Oryza barthii TaxID=65489 RepID=A0A0D3FBN7_9ORYZ